MQALFLSELGSVLAGFLEVVPKLNQFRALRAHSRILRFAVAERNDNCDGNIEPLSGERD